MRFDFEAFAAECPSAIVVVADDGTIVFANRALASLVGFGLQELEREGFSAIVPASRRPPKGKGWIRHLFDGAAPGGHIVGSLMHRSSTEFELEWSLIAGHDSTGRHLVQIVLSAQPPAQPQPRGPTANVPAIHPIVFQHAPIGIFLFDPRGTITDCNDRFVHIIGSSRRHLVGLKMPTLPNAAIAAVALRAIDGELATYEGPYTSATGAKSSFVRVIMAPVKNDKGAVVSGVGLVEDVTEQRRASEIVAATERLASLGTLAAGVVHEVQNPLAYVLANLDLALRQLDGGGPGEDLRGAILSAREGTARVASIVRDLKTFAKSDEALRGPVDVAAVIDTAAKLTEAAVMERATLHKRIEEVEAVWASESRLVQLFVNLLMNAAEAIPAGAAASNSIDVHAYGLEDGRVRVDVEDTGPGISADDGARIFEPYWTSKTSGMGLGLAICLGIVTSMGGEIFLEERRPPDARGARFSVILPSARGRISSLLARVTLPPASPPVASRPRGRVLVVDDEQRLAETLKLTLSVDHEVTIATRGPKALELILAGPPFDVVLCDLVMPDLSGPELYAEVLANRPEIAPRFVFLSGGAFSEHLREFLHRVENARIEKPFDLEALEALIHDRVAFARAAPAETSEVGADDPPSSRR